MSFIKELKRRNVVRMAALYVIAAWLIMQVADVLKDLANLPDWIGPTVLGLLAIGFPIALILSWFYELTPEGISLEKDVERDKSITHITGRRLDFIVISLLAAAVVLFAYDKWWTRDPPEQSIAVLPFENMSRESASDPFVIGIHDDVLTQISRISALKVISRTSVIEYRDTTKNLKTIGDELGVATVLEGGVQQAGDRVRINVQLVDTRTDEHLWADTYDRELTAANIFAIQSEIATAIADELRTRLSPAEQKRLETVPTENFAALEAYFHGKQRLAKRTSMASAEAVEYFQQAIALDPDFALAYVGLADSYNLQASYGGLPPDEMFPKMDAALDKALELDDQLGEAYASLGALKWQQFDLESAEEAFKRAIDQTPNYATAHQWYGGFLIETGRADEALVRFRKARELDPLSAIINDAVGIALERLGRFDEALAQYKKVIELDPAFPRAYYTIGSAYWRVFGQLDEAVAWYRKAIALDHGNPFGPAMLGSIYLDLGDEQQAERWINRSMELAPESFWPNVTMEFLHVYRGEKAEALRYARKVLPLDPTAWLTLAYLSNHDLQAGRNAEARARIESVYPALLNEDTPKIDRANYVHAIALAYVLSNTGEQERADLLLDRSLTFVPTIPRLGWAGHRISDVRIYALQGRSEAALAALRHAIDEKWRTYWWYYLIHDPSLQSIRNEPDFQAMVEEIKADMAAQLERVKEMDASGELEPVPEVQ